MRLAVRSGETAPLRELAHAAGCPLAKTLGPEPDMPLLDYFQLLQELSFRGGDETCHLSARPLAFGTTNFIVETLLAARDLEDAMKRTARAYNLMHGGQYNRVECRPDRIRYVIDDQDFPYTRGTDPDVLHAAMEGVLILLHAMLSFATGNGLTDQLLAVRSRRAVRRAPDGLLSFWTAPVRCNSTVYALEYRLPAAAVPVRNDLANAAGLVDIYETVARMIAAREQTLPLTDFPTRVVNAINSGTTAQPHIARALGVSTATLRRRLADSSVTFRDLRVRALNENALTLLKERRQIGGVAETLGFADGRSFSRAFKSWNGVTPAAFVTSLPEVAPPIG